MANYEKLTALFSDSEFIESINDLDNLDAVYAVVAGKIPEVGKDELESYLTAVAEHVNTDEISENELDNVSGGVTFMGAVAGAYAVVKLLNGCYTMGSNLGKLIGNLRN